MIAAGPAAYLRKSVTRDPSREVSREMQEASVRRMAAAYGDADRLGLYVDWGMSGGKANRPDYLRLKAAIAAGSVTTLYAYSMSRLGRNARELLDLFETCKARGVKVMCEAEGTIGADSAMGKFTLTIMAAVAELEREQAVERSASALAARVARGDVLGHAAYGKVHVKRDGVIRVEVDPKRSAQPVIDAYGRAGSVLGATRILNAAGVPSPRGCLWTTSTVARVIDMNQPGALPRKTITGRRTPSHDALSSLVRCPFCTTMLTPGRARKLYYCHKGHEDRSSHPRFCANERRLMEFAEAEAGLLLIPDVEILADGLEAQRSALEEKRSRWIEQYGERLIDKKTRDARLAAIDRDTAALEAEAGAVRLPASIDWRAGIAHPTELNQVLRTIWREIRLDSDMHPIDALWTNPAWRRAS
jgi:DNA invertase Pin-like site-specific DNA recombinase